MNEGQLVCEGPSPSDAPVGDVRPLDALSKALNEQQEAFTHWKATVQKPRPKVLSIQHEKKAAVVKHSSFVSMLIASIF